MAEGSCSVDDCERARAKRGMCGMHYQRVWKFGAPDMTRRGPICTTCLVEGCSKSVRSRTSGYCEMHYYRRRRHGDALVVVDTRRDDTQYRAAHKRIAQDRGLARERSCVDCDRQADHWSYTHADPDERYAAGGQPYSLQPQHYEPRCASCHALFDATGANQYTA